MRLYLVRHAEANPKETDPARHLSARGEKDLRKVARFLKPLGLGVQAIWHSPKTRAVETAEVLATAIKAKKGLVQRSDLGPDADVRPAAKEIERFGADLALVGHMPMVALLTSQLVCGDVEQELAAFPTAAVLCLEHCPHGYWMIVWMVTPALLP